MTPTTKRIGVIDFFCGCGGTSAGLKAAGMEIIAGLDIDPIALNTYKHNFPEAETISKNILEVATQQIGNLAVSSGCDVIVFSACAPCQPFSQQNRLKTESDKRISLLDELHRFVEGILPDYIVLENVPGMQKVKEGPFIKFQKLLDRLGYSYDLDVKDAKSYGVPQTRRRLVLMASKHGKITLPQEQYGKGLVPYKNVWQTIQDYPALNAGEVHDNVPNHACAQISEINLTRLRHTPEGGDRRDWPSHLTLKCHMKSDGYTDTYGRLSKSKPSVTLTTKCISISNGRFGHPEQNRALSVREAAAIQTFDDKFVFIGTVNQTAKQVGNAVPVLFAKALGLSLVKHCENI